MDELSPRPTQPYQLGKLKHGNKKKPLRQNIFLWHCGYIIYYLYRPTGGAGLVTLVESSRFCPFLCLSDLEEVIRICRGHYRTDPGGVRDREEPEDRLLKI